MTVKIPDLPAGTAVDGTEPVESVQGGVSVQLSVAQLTKNIAGLSLVHGDVFYVDSNGDIQNLGFGTSGQFLETLGAGVDPRWGTPAGAATTFLGLTDTPASYVGEALKIARVNEGENALEFAYEQPVPALFTWRFDTSTVMADPGAQDFRVNNAVAANVTQFSISDISDRLQDVSIIFTLLKPGDTLYFQASTDITKSGRYVIDSIIDNTDWHLINVTYVSDGGGGMPANNQRCFIAFVFNSVSGGGGDMDSAVYDPANIAEQLIGETAIQTIINKTLTTPVLTLNQSAAPTPTAEGDIQWDTNDHKIYIGDGTGSLKFSDDAFNAANFAPIVHTHSAADIVSGVLAHERGGLEADVSAYNGLVLISAGATNERPIGIADKDILEVDGAAGNPNAAEYARFTATGLEGRTTTEHRNDIGLGTGDSPTFKALTLTDGNISFPATAVLSADVNTLDDYEEGTWTPTYVAATDFDSVTYDSVTGGWYVKVGCAVSIGFRLRTDAITIGAGAGLVYVGGVPFTSPAASQSQSNLAFGNSTAFAVNHPRSGDYFLLSGSPTFAIRTTPTATGASGNLTATDMGTGGNANNTRASAIYKTDE